jgi:hypothetical protein
LGGRVYMVVILELCHGEKVRPIILPLTTKEPQVLFQFLIYPFCLPIRLRVVSRGLSCFDSQ